MEYSLLGLVNDAIRGAGPGATIRIHSSHLSALEAPTAIGGEGSQGPAGPSGSTGPAGPQGDTGPAGHAMDR